MPARPAEEDAVWSPRNDEPARPRTAPSGDEDAFASEKLLFAKETSSWSRFRTALGDDEVDISHPPRLLAPKAGRVKGGCAKSAELAPEDSCAGKPAKGGPEDESEPEKGGPEDESVPGELFGSSLCWKAASRSSISSACRSSSPVGEISGPPSDCLTPGGKEDDVQDDAAEDEVDVAAYWSVVRKVPGNAKSGMPGESVLRNDGSWVRGEVE